MASQMNAAMMVSARKRNKARQVAAGKRSEPYSTRVIKAGALLGDTKTLLAHWDSAQTTQENLRRFRQENLFGKASRSRVADILAIFRRRYLSEEAVTKALVVLVHKQFPAASLDRILFFHAAKADRLLEDVVTEVLVPLQAQGITDVGVSEIRSVLTKWVGQARTTAPWSEPTTVRVTQGLLSTLRDFGVLQGAVKKRIAPAYLPVEAFAYVAYFLKQHQPSAAKLAELPDWKLFFLSREGVERFFMEAHQRHLLEYYAAGMATRLTFPVHTLEEYADVLAARAH